MLDFESDIENLYGKYLVIERHLLQIQDIFKYIDILSFLLCIKELDLLWVNPNFMSSSISVSLSLLMESSRKNEHGDDRKEYKARREYRCDICVFLTSSKKSLIAHKKSEHLNEPMGEDLSLQCDQCGYVCISQPTLKAHIQAVHDKARGIFILI